MILYIILFVVLLGVAAITRTPWFKGWEGEMTVNLGLKWILDKKTYHLISNITLAINNGTTQIDHVVVSRYGIFSIETKNMRGAIYGSANNRQWTQAIGRRKHQFMNPLHQNYKHTMALAETLGVPHDRVKSVIIFIGDAKLKTKDNLPANVLSRGLTRFIKSHRQELLTEAEVGRALQVIQERRLVPGLTTHRLHVKHIKEVQSQRESARRGNLATSPFTPSPDIGADQTLRHETGSTPTAEAPCCPKCGRTMVLRTANRGSNKGRRFWGCADYPKCKGIVQA